MATLKRWKIDAGNSSTGPCGFVVYDLLAPTAEAALKKVKETYVIPDTIESKDEDEDGNRVTTVCYINADALTLDDIEEDDSDEDDEDKNDDDDDDDDDEEEERPNGK